MAMKTMIMMMTMMMSMIAACARAFYLAGCKLILCARTVQELQPVKAELESLSMVRHECICVVSEVFCSFVIYSKNH